MARALKPNLIERAPKLVWGVCDSKPIVGAPHGRKRLRMRGNDAARLFVKSNGIIRHFVLEDLGDRWFCNPGLE